MEVDCRSLGLRVLSRDFRGISPSLKPAGLLQFGIQTESTELEDIV